MTGSQAFLIQWYLEETRLSNQKNSVNWIQMYQILWNLENIKRR